MLMQDINAAIIKLAIDYYMNSILAKRAQRWAVPYRFKAHESVF